jgi:hypothetical protein
MGDQALPAVSPPQQTPVGTPLTGEAVPVTVPANKPAAQSADTELCATLHKSLKGGGRLIALVVRAKDHKAAQTFADAQIKTIAPAIEENALEAAEPAGEAAKVDTGEETPEKKEAAEVVLPTYTSIVMLAGNKSTGMPLGGGGATKPNTENRFTQNYDKLTALLRSQTQFTTWLVLHHTKKIANVPKSDTTSYFNDTVSLRNKTVVVVRSEVFWLPSIDQSNTAPAEQQCPIFVCSIPASNITGSQYDSEDSTKHYAEAFMQISAFVAEYNKTNTDNADKIDLVALAYPLDLYTAYTAAILAAKKKKPAPATAKSNGTANKPSPAHQAKKAPSKVGAPSGAPLSLVSTEYEDDDDDDDDDDDGDQSPVAQIDQRHRTEMSFYWLKAVAAFESRHGNDVKLRIMHNANSIGYKTPVLALSYFNKRILVDFPSCVDPSNEHHLNDPGNQIGLAQVRKTLFVCDRVAGKRVGNDNNDATCGGTFGQWVPMHFTSSRISADKYANARELNALIDVIESDHP